MARMLNFIAGQADKVHGLSLPTHTPDVLGLTLREPYGVVGAIIPWNAPAPMFVIDVGPAIAAGNTIVVKPAEDAPLTSLALARLALEAGIPPGVINVVTGYGHEAGAAIPAHRGIRRLSFTGSPDTGSAVMAACAKNLTPLHLELGGKSPQVVFADADLDEAIPRDRRGITLNTGQICAAGSRVVVDRSIHAEVVERLAERIRQVRVGPWHQQVQMGPLINAKQHERVLDYMELGQRGGRRPGRSAAASQRREVRARLLRRADPVRPRRPADAHRPGGDLRAGAVGDPGRRRREALAVANGTDYGLVASVWTRASAGRSGSPRACRPDRSR